MKDTQDSQSIFKSLNVEKAPTHTTSIVAWVWFFSAPYKILLLSFFAFRTFRYTIFALFPLIVGLLIDGLEQGSVQENPEAFTTPLLGFMLLYAICMVNVIFIPEMSAVEKAARGLTLYSIAHFNKLSLTWHESAGSGGKLQRIMTARRCYQELMRNIRWDFFDLLGALIAIFITFYTINIPIVYALYFAGFLGTYLWASWFFSRTYFVKFNHFNVQFEALLSGVYEFVSAIRTVKAFNLSKSIIDKAERLEKKGHDAVTDAFGTNLVRWTICNLTGTFWLFIFIWFGLHDVLDNTISVGAFTAIFFLATRIWGLLEIVGNILEKVYEYGNGIQRLAQMLCLQPKNMDLEPAQTLEKNWQKITFNTINFAYPTTAKDNETGPGLHNINFAIKRGEKIALVGPSGAGKSTFVKLFMKQMLPCGGTIHIENSNLSHIKTDDWLSAIGFVPQDVELFNLSIRDNILLDYSDIDEDTYQMVLKQAAIDDLIDSLADGDQTVIGERGIKLSGGQRQRLGIARALARQADIIILDEATSSLDSLSENHIQNAIEHKLNDKTLIVIAHRLSTIRHVDRIFVMDHGHIVEEGSFADLKNRKNSLFAKLWDIQSQDQKAI